MFFAFQKKSKNVSIPLKCQTPLFIFDLRSIIALKKISLEKSDTYYIRTKLNLFFIILLFLEAKYQIPFINF